MEHFYAANTTFNWTLSVSANPEKKLPNEKVLEPALEILLDNEVCKVDVCCAKLNKFFVESEELD